MNYELWGSLAVIIGTGAYVPYIRDMARGTIKPHGFSWLIWGILTGIAFAAQIADNAGPGAWINATTTIACLGIAAYALIKAGRADITRSDWCFLIGALAAIPLWLATSTPLYSVILITIIDALGFAPTIRKGWQKPNEEQLLIFILSAVKYVFSLMGMANHTVINDFYPIALVLMNALFAGMLYYRRKGSNG